MQFITLILLYLPILLFIPQKVAGTEKEATEEKFAIVIHAGAGNFTPDDLSEAFTIRARNGLDSALEAGYMMLRDGHTALDVVEKVIIMLENNPLFNAGKGSVYTREGKIEMDASVMDGKTLNAGAVAGVSHIKNPIAAARLVMEKSGHVLLAGDGADNFALEHNMTFADSSYFFTQRRWNSYIKKSKKDFPGHETVGCVVLDKHGNLAAGTSTGGTTYKMAGRIGDSPVIGAGTYADNKTCAVSCTGKGEYFIRFAVAHDISALMEYKNLSLKEAADFVILKKLKNAGGPGGIIALDHEGNIAVSFNTSGMFRAFKTSEGKKEILFFKNDKL